MVQSIVSKITQDFGVDGAALSALLKKHEAILAGSFPLAYLTEWSFEPNDLDIWIPYTACDDFYALLTENGFEKDTSKYDTMNFGAFQYRLTSLAHYVSSVKEFVKDSKRIQLMELKSVAMQPNDRTTLFITCPRDVLKRFDYNICKVGYDGEHLLVEDSVRESIKQREIIVDYQESYVNTQLNHDGESYIHARDIHHEETVRNYENYVQDMIQTHGKEKAKALIVTILTFMDMNNVNSITARQVAIDLRREERKKKYEARGFTFVPSTVESKET